MSATNSSQMVCDRKEWLGKIGQMISALEHTDFFFYSEMITAILGRKIEI